ncbi:hypothetical protein [Nostoc sp.]|uniref:hypothetical protein n=1 Tax=Nostoc sp. TaxID=1180 RepID=UPI002FF8971E
MPNTSAYLGLLRLRSVQVARHKSQFDCAHRKLSTSAQCPIPNTSASLRDATLSTSAQI